MIQIQITITNIHDDFCNENMLVVMFTPLNDGNRLCYKGLHVNWFKGRVVVVDVVVVVVVVAVVIVVIQSL